MGGSMGPQGSDWPRTRVCSGFCFPAENKGCVSTFPLPRKSKLPHSWLFSPSSSIPALYSSLIVLPLCPLTQTQATHYVHFHLWGVGMLFPFRNAFPSSLLCPPSCPTQSHLFQGAPSYSNSKLSPLAGLRSRVHIPS
jgi:hypothetical protein